MPGQFLVPQFIEVETRIIGPITTRQFFIMLIDGMICFIWYKLFYFNTFVVVTVLQTTVFGIVAFAKINGQPFHLFFLNLLQTFKHPRLRVWTKELVVKVVEPEPEEAVKRPPAKPALPTSRLSSLSLVVDTGGAYNPSGESTS